MCIFLTYHSRLGYPVFGLYILAILNTTEILSSVTIVQTVVGIWVFNLVKGRSYKTVDHLGASINRETSGTSS